MCFESIRVNCVYGFQLSEKKVAIFNNPDHKLHEMCVDLLTQFLKVAFYIPTNQKLKRLYVF